MSGCIRTVNEEPCYMCKRITNAYDAAMGRLCPQDIARQATQFGYNLNHQFEFPFHTVSDEEVKNDPLNAYLYTAPLIDHSNDIDKDFTKEPTHVNVEGAGLGAGDILPDWLLQIIIDQTVAFAEKWIHDWTQADPEKLRKNLKWRIENAMREKGATFNEKTKT